MILRYRETAMRMAIKILARWGAHLENDEVESIRDLALCEAAKGFNPKSGSHFLTYFYFFLRGFLVREITRRTCKMEEVGFQSDLPEERGAQQFTCERDCFMLPDDIAYQDEVKQRCALALGELSPTEQQVVSRIHLYGYQVTSVARQLGLSRGYVSELRRKAFDKLRVKLEELKEAA